MQLFSLIIYNSAPGLLPAPAVLCNSAVAFLFALIKFQHSYGYQAQAQIATSLRLDILRFKCLLSGKWQQKCQFREMSGGVKFPCKERGFGISPFKRWDERETDGQGDGP